MQKHRGNDVILRIVKDRMIIKSYQCRLSQCHKSLYPSI
jgi:hypothetical protein